jgi:hypothetical protein
MLHTNVHDGWPLKHHLKSVLKLKRRGQCVFVVGVAKFGIGVGRADERPDNRTVGRTIGRTYGRTIKPTGGRTIGGSGSQPNGHSAGWAIEGADGMAI